MRRADLIELIAEDILSVAKQRAEESSDLVAAIHGVWIEVGIVLGRRMDEMRGSERAGSVEK